MQEQDVTIVISIITVLTEMVLQKCRRLFAAADGGGGGLDAKEEKVALAKTFSWMVRVFS